MLIKSILGRNEKGLIIVFGGGGGWDDRDIYLVMCFV